MWSKFDDQFYLNPKIAQLDRDEQDIYLAGIIYCNGQLTDGYIPNAVLMMLFVWAKLPIEANAQANAQALAQRLVEHGCWELSNGGYQVHDFLEWNISREEAIALREARSEAGKRGGQKSAAIRQASAQASAQAKSKQNSTQSPSPDPIREELNNIDAGAKPPTPEAKKTRAKQSPEQQACNLKAKELITTFIEVASIEPITRGDWGKWTLMAKYLTEHKVTPEDIKAAYHHERQYGKNPISWIGSIKARAISQHREQ